MATRTLQGANRAIAVADTAVADLEELRRRLDREIRRLLLALDTQPGSDALSRDRASLATAARARRQVVEALATEGVTAVETIAQQRALQAAEALSGGVPIPTDVRQEIQRIVAGQTREVASVFAEASDAMRRAINAGTTTGGSLADLVDDVAARLQTATVRAQAAVDAAVMASGRTVVVKAAQASGLDLVYQYVGPQDGKNRPFCAALVGKAVTPALLARLDNGQGLPAESFCGGYNCRHSWAPLLRGDVTVEVLS